MHSMLRRIGIASVAASALMVAGWGCGGGRPAVDTSTTEATVSGVVTIKGKPAAGGTISFDPSNVERKFEAVRSAPIGEDGAYSVTTLVGQNQVSFSGPMINQYPEIANESFMHDLEAGENSIDFELAGEGASTP
jgi:hypothetical protein